MSSHRFPVALGITLIACMLASALDASAAADGKTVVKCQAALKKQGAKFVAKKLGALAKCTDGVGKCIQTVEDEAKRTACVTKARGGCLKSLAVITAARQAYIGAVAGTCAALDPAQVTGADGLGFGTVDCSEFGGAVGAAAEVAACLAAQHGCLASRIFQLAVPRALELMQFTPPPAVVVPPADLDAVACLDDHGGAGADVADGALGKGLLKCQKAITKAATKLTSGRLKAVAKCVDALFACNQTKSGDDRVKCRDKARAGCVKGFDKLQTQSTGLAGSLAKSCGDAAVFAALRDPAGGNVDALLPSNLVRAGDAAACASLATIADYQSCLRSESARLADDLVRFEAPTAATLLGAVGCDLGSCGAAPTPTTTPVGPTSTTGGTPTPHATVTPGGGCPTTYELTFNGTAADEDLGYTGAYHDEPLPSNVRLTMSISDCANPLTPCGECVLSGPIANGGGTAFGNRRCRGTAAGADGSWITCTGNADCPGTGNACVFFAGPPQGLIGVPLCLMTEIASPIAGAIDLASGATDLDLDLRVATFAGVSSFHPCPSCVSGLCSGGERAGEACTVQGHSTFTGDDVSLDCPPEVPMHPIGVRRYRMPLSTSTSSVTLGAASPTCTGAPGTKCFCQTCNDAASTPCFDDDDCEAVGATTCGGRRCSAGVNVGLPCTSFTQCPAATCAVPGSNTAPNACNDDVCTANPSDLDSVNEGVCLAGPNYQGCAIEELRGCNTNADCTFPGDSCTTHTYNCFTDNGALGSTISVSGIPSTFAPTFGGLFCLPPTTSLAVDLFIGLPGLGRVTLPATAVVQ